MSDIEAPLFSKPTILLYKDWYEQILILSDEQQNKLLHAIFKFGIDGSDVLEQESDKMVKMLLMQITNCIKRDEAKWRKKCETNRQNASKKKDKNNQASDTPSDQATVSDSEALRQKKIEAKNNLRRMSANG